MPRSLSRGARGGLWAFVAVVSLVGVGLLALQWRVKHRSYRPDEGQLSSRAAVDSVQREFPAGAVSIETGIFLQSLQFESASDVHVTGWVWQAGQSDRMGLILPEAVFSASNIPPDLEGEGSAGEGMQALANAMSSDSARSSPFEATLRQSFNYRDYPLDHKTVWIRMWSSDSEVFLVPRLEDYASTEPGVAFGLDPAIVMGGWVIEESFFDYKCPGREDERNRQTFRCREYDTNFGELNQPLWQGYPELYFNVVIRRQFRNAFIAHLLPLAVVASLLFAMMLTVTADRQRAEVAGFSTTSVVAGASGLFFVTLLDHVQLRNQVAGDAIVYLETFHFLIYLALIAVTANTFWFTSRTGWRPRWLTWEDNLIPKLAYWPVLLFLINSMTWSMLAH